MWQLAELIEGIYLEGMDKEGREEFRRAMLGRTSELEERVRLKGERRGWNELRIQMEIALEQVGNDDKARADVRNKYAERARQAKAARRGDPAANPSGSRTERPQPDQGPARPPGGMPVDTDSKGRRVYEG